MMFPVFPRVPRGSIYSLFFVRGIRPIRFIRDSRIRDPRRRSRLMIPVIGMGRSGMGRPGSLFRFAFFFRTKNFQGLGEGQRVRDHVAFSFVFENGITQVYLGNGSLAA